MSAMALVNSHIEGNRKDIGFKVEGDLGDLQINAPSDGEEDGTERDKAICSKNIESLANFPSNLVQTSNAPVFGNVAVANSKNVHLGNNTHFHGPVTIKQIIQSKSGVENSSYNKTEEDTDPSDKHKNVVKNDVTSTKKYHIQPWHKIVFTATCVIIAVVVFTLVLLLQGKNNKSEDSSPDGDVDTPDATVVGVWYDNLALITFSITLVVLTMQLYPLLTYNMLGDDEKHIHDTSMIPDTCRYIENGMGNVVPKDELLIAPNHLRIVSRTDWLAQPPADNDVIKLPQPVPWVVITHTATENCHYQNECVLRVRLIQMFHVESRKWSDIGYNFLIGGDGSAYYGRGWDIQGAHTLGYNKYSIGIAFIGTFNNEPPPTKQIEACKKLIKLGVQLGKLPKDYKLFAHRQLASTLSPGDKLFDIMKSWPNFVNDTSNVSALIPHY